MIPTHSVIDDFLPKALAEKLAIKYLGASYRFFWRSKEINSSPEELISHWHIELVDNKRKQNNKGKRKLNRYDLSKKFEAKKECLLEHQVWLLIKKYLPKPLKLLRTYVNAHTFGTEGLPHKDSNIPGDLTAIVYLNEHWDMAWAGETVIFSKNGDIAKAVLPKFRRALIFPGNQLHAARALSRICPALRIVLVFKFCLA